MQVYQEHSKACAYKSVFSLDLKHSTEGADLTARGILFQRVGPAKAKARSPMDLLLDVRISNTPLSADLRFLMLGRYERSCEM